jgi:IS5 family transposase
MIKGKIGQSKRHYGLDLIREKLATTQDSSIAMNVLVTNPKKLQNLPFILFAICIQLLISLLGAQRPNMRGYMSYQLSGK